MVERLNLRDRLLPMSLVGASLVAPAEAAAGTAQPVASELGGIMMNTSNGFIVDNTSIRDCQVRYPKRANTTMGPDRVQNYISDADFHASGNKVIGALSVRDTQLSGGDPRGIHRQDFDCDEVITVTTIARVFNARTGKTIAQKSLDLDDNGALNSKPKLRERRGFTVKLPEKASRYGNLGVKMIVKTTPNYDAPYTFAPFEPGIDKPNAPHSRKTSGSYRKVAVK